MIKRGLVKGNPVTVNETYYEPLTNGYKSCVLENDLIERCLAGENDAHQELYQKYSGVMLKICLKYVTDFHRAEDALQEGFVQVFRSLKYFRHQCSLKTWMTRIFTRVAIQLYRRDIKHKKREEDLDEIENRITIAPPVDTHHNMQAIKHLINQLPKRARMVFVMYFVEGYSHKDIARELGICEGTSKSQLARAKAWVKKRINT